VSGAAGVTTVESVVVVVESAVVVFSPLLLQATNAPAIANITKNFFIVLFLKFS
jgi:hypothetical protein